MQQVNNLTMPHGRVDAPEPYGEISSALHRFYKGKMAVTLKVPITSAEDFAIFYTPGVAGPCREIFKDPEKIYEYTNLGNQVAIITDGSRILGLGNIGRAGLPVMEGKALIYKYFGDVDAFPICLSTQDPDEIVQATKWIASSFGGINLEDISSPKCFQIFKRLTEELEIPVFYDDYQGTAIVVLAGLLNALKLVGKQMESLHVAFVGAGTASIGCMRLMTAAGVKPGNMVIADSRGIIYEGRENMEAYKTEIAKMTNDSKTKGGIKEALKGADIAVCLSRPGPGILTKEMILTMADRPIVFALANPVPEILPDDAKKAGARVVATGRSDLPNQVNNSLGFPGIFRGVLDVRATGINTEMMLSAAHEIARFAEEKGLREDYIVPDMMDLPLYPRVAAAVGESAVSTGMARIKLSRQALRENAESRIDKYQRSLHSLVKNGFIANNTS